MPWFFDTNPSSPTLGLVMTGRTACFPAKSSQFRPTTAGTARCVHLPSAQTVLDPGTSSRAVKLAMQTLDANGNFTQSAIYDFTNPSGNPLRQHNNTYTAFTVFGPFYRLSTGQLSGYINGAYNSPLALTTNYYDGARACSGYLGDAGKRQRPARARRREFSRRRRRQPHKSPSASTARSAPNTTCPAAPSAAGYAGPQLLDLVFKQLRCARGDYDRLVLGFDDLVPVPWNPNPEQRRRDVVGSI